MPTFLTIYGLKFFFYSDDHEPFHVHVRKSGKEAKFIIGKDGSVNLAWNKGLKKNELSLAESLIEDNKKAFAELWVKFFTTEVK